jgi:hypothetical protein
MTDETRIAGTVARLHRYRDALLGESDLLIGPSTCIHAMDQAATLISEMEECLSLLTKSSKEEVDDKGGAGGYHLARIADADNLLKQADL